MNIPYQRIRFSVKILLIPLLAYLIVLWGRQDVAIIIDNYAVQILAILVGLVIGAVAVLISSLANLFNNLLSLDLNKKPDIDAQIGNWIEDCHDTIQEVKQDVLFLIAALSGCFILYLAKYVDIPLLKWPFASGYMAKDVLLTWISLSLLGYSFLAIEDVVMTMFTIYEHHEIALEYEITSNSSKCEL